MFYDAIVCNRMRQRARIGVLCLHKLDRSFEWPRNTRETPKKNPKETEQNPRGI
jgi:hypothetical protein